MIDFKKLGPSVIFHVKNSIYNASKLENFKNRKQIVFFFHRDKIKINYSFKM